MSTYSDRYKARMGEQSNGSNREVRMKQTKATYNRNFKDVEGYREGILWDRDTVDSGHQKESTPIDVVMTTNSNGYEKLLTFRPDTKIKIGSYIKIKEFEGDEEPKTYIVRELMKPDPVPTYKAFECSQTLLIKGCPIPFPCFSYNSTYSSKGLIDADVGYTLDSRNKLYIQKNKFSCRLWEYYHGYRIRLGDEEGWVTFKITEMDDFSYKGMFIVSLKVEQSHHLDGAEEPTYAWNEREIDFSDLISEVNDDGVISEPVEALYLDYENYGRVGKEFEIVSNKPIKEWEYDATFFDDDIIAITDTFMAMPIKSGMTTIKATDTDGQTETVTLIIKEVL